MRAKLISFQSNDVSNWGTWQPEDPANVTHWFSVEIGDEDSAGSERFQVLVATRQAIRERPNKHEPFKGLCLEPFDPGAVERLLREHVSRICGERWHDIVEQLRKTMSWEYEGMAP